MRIVKGVLFYRNRNIHIITLALLAVGIYFLFIATTKTIENYRLKDYGKEAKAVIVSKKKVGAKGTIELNYEFIVDGRTYKGSSNHNVRLNISDSIKIYYLEDNPAINRSHSLLGR